MKILSKILGVIALVITVIVINQFIYQKNFDSKFLIIEESSKLEKSMSIENKEIIIGHNTIITGDINIKNGKVIIRSGCKIYGSISSNNGDIIIESNVYIKGNITLEKGNINLNKNVEIDGNIDIKIGYLQKHSLAKINGKKPSVYEITNRHPSLKYFDLLPTRHKQVLGYVIITKKSPTSILETGVNKDNYFDSIRQYKNNNLTKIDLSSSKRKIFFDKAYKFYKSLPKRRLRVYSVGGTTQTYAHNRRHPDIYIPSYGSEYVFIHEMGHVLDMKYGYIDSHKPSYPWVSKEAPLNDYAATHLGEDFAEAYKYYVLNKKYFDKLIKEIPSRQKKYDYLKRYVFKNREYK